MKINTLMYRKKRNALLNGTVNFKKSKTKRIWIQKSYMKEVLQLFLKIYSVIFFAQLKLIVAKQRFLCFGEDIIQRNEGTIVDENRKYIVTNCCKIGTIYNFKCQYAIFLSLLETFVRFRYFSYEILEKYMQTKEPFHREVGYNILGEGQQFVDEKTRSTYNSNELPVLTMNQLLDHNNIFFFVQEVYYYDN